jgi:replicative DNA helicase
MAEEEKKESRKNEAYVLAAEYRLLNATIHSPTYLEDSRVHEGVFPHFIARSILKAIEQLHTEKIPITVPALFQAANEIDYNITTEVVNQVFSIDTGADKIDDMLRVLSRARQKADLQEKINGAAYIASQKGDIDPALLSTKLYEIEQILSEAYDKQVLQDMDTWFERYLKDLRTRVGRKPYLFGDPLLDDAAVKGPYPGAITIVAGATGMGKSAFVLNLINGMINQQIPCMYISLEMSGIDQMDRLISLRREIPADELYSPGVAMEGIIKIVEEERKLLTLNGQNFYFVEEPSLSLAQIQSLIKEFKQRTKNKYCVVTIDLLSMVQDFTKTAAGSNSATSIEYAMNHLNAIAKQENVHIIGVVQFGRDADKIKVTEFDDLFLLRPSLNDIKGANAYAERSRLVLGCFRAKHYADIYIPNDEKVKYLEDEMEVQVLKQNGGRKPRLKYMFDGEIMRVVPIIEDKPKEVAHSGEEPVNDPSLNY